MLVLIQSVATSLPAQCSIRHEAPPNSCLLKPLRAERQWPTAFPGRGQHLVHHSCCTVGSSSRKTCEDHNRRWSPSLKQLQHVVYILLGLPAGCIFSEFTSATLAPQTFETVGLICIQTGKAPNVPRNVDNMKRNQICISEPLHKRHTLAERGRVSLAATAKQYQSTIILCQDHTQTFPDIPNRNSRKFPKSSILVGISLLKPPIWGFPMVFLWFGVPSLNV